MRTAHAPLVEPVGPELHAAQRRTSSAAFTIHLMTDDPIRVTRSVSIPRFEIELRFSRSSGPGGQHAQKSDTRVEAVFDVEASTALSDAQKRRVLAKAGPVVRAVAQDERSQWRNRELAYERIADALREALRVRRPRRATKPSKAAVERRLDTKRRRGATKRLRRPPE
jgi:ribosome-associated protein